MATDETPFPFTVLALAVVQSVVSVFYMRRAKASSSIFRRREEGIPLSILLGVSYLGYCYGIVAYLIDPEWMSWSAIKLVGSKYWAERQVLFLFGVIEARHIGISAG